MSGLELPTVTGAAWVAWEPLTTGDLLTTGLTAVLGVAALSLAAWGLVMMRSATAARDAQTRMMDERTAALLRGLETVIRQTAPGAGGEAA